MRTFLPSLRQDRLARRARPRPAQESRRPPRGRATRPATPSDRSCALSAKWRPQMSASVAGPTRFIRDCASASAHRRRRQSARAGRTSSTIVGRERRAAAHAARRTCASRLVRAPGVMPCNRPAAPSEAGRAAASAARASFDRPPTVVEIEIGGQRERLVAPERGNVLCLARQIGRIARFYMAFVRERGGIATSSGQIARAPLPAQGRGSAASRTRCASARPARRERRGVPSRRVIADSACSAAPTPRRARQRALKVRARARCRAQPQARARGVRRRSALSVAQRQPVFGARGEHAVGFGDAARHQIVDHHANIGLGAVEHRGALPGRRARRVQPGDQALRGGLLIAGRAVDLSGAEQAGDIARRRARASSCARIDMVIFDRIARPDDLARAPAPGCVATIAACTSAAARSRCRSGRRADRRDLRAQGRSGARPGRRSGAILSSIDGQ